MVETRRYPPTKYYPGTDSGLIAFFEDQYSRDYEYRDRIRITYGNLETGESWLEEFDVEGKLGRASGRMDALPILLHNRSSSGGGTIPTASILRITKTTKPYEVLYCHPNYKVPSLTMYPDKEGMMCVYRWKTNDQGRSVSECVARFETHIEAVDWVNKMTR
jgi:hypothetical protein